MSKKLSKSCQKKLSKNKRVAGLNPAWSLIFCTKKLCKKLSSKRDSNPRPFCFSTTFFDSFFDSFFDNFFDNFSTTFWQLFDNFLTTFLTCLNAASKIFFFYKIFPIESGIKRRIVYWNEKNLNSLKEFFNLWIRTTNYIRIFKFLSKNLNFFRFNKQFFF